MTTKINTQQLQPTALASLQGPVITNIQVTDSSYTVLDDTAVDIAGGYIKITGLNFVSGCTVSVGQVAATSVAFVDSTTLRVQVPATAAGTYIIYVANPDGGVAIRVNGITFSGMPTWVTGSALSGDADTAASIQLSATGATTYSIVSGSLPSGWTLSSSGLLSGTVTGLALDTIYNVIITATDAELQDSPRSFAITISAGDPYWNYVTTLLSASTPSTLPFNDDASTNNFAVAINGDTKPNNFNPYTPGYYSNYFDGSGDYLSTPSTGNFTAAGDFTFSCWVYPTSFAIQTCITTNFPTNDTNSFSFEITTSGNIVIYVNGVSSVRITSSTALTLNNWSFITVARSSTTTTLYINGVSQGTYVASYTLGNATRPVIIGMYNSAEYFTGYIADYRWVTGSVITTVPTVPTTAVSGTQLLTCQSNRFIDSSTNNFTITKAGDTKVSSFVPYIPNTSYSTYGSTYFDGTGDYLNNTSDTINASLAAADFTIECWVNSFQSVAGVPIITYASGGGGATLTNWGIFANSGIPRFVVSDGTTYQVLINATSTITNSWMHIAVTKSGSVYRLFINGVQEATATWAGTPMSTTRAVILGGNTGTVYYNGYLSDVRIVKGTALYTSTFTPPTAPLTAVTNTSLLTCQSNQPVANNTFLDNSTSNFAITRAGNATQGTFSPYGAGYSVYFPNASYMNTQSAAGAYTSIPNTSNFDLGTGDFTMEGWIFPMQLPSADTWPTNWQNHSSLFGRGTAGTADGYNLVLGATKLIFQSSDTAVLSGTHNIVIGNWYHVAVSRTSGTLRLFVNGISIASVSYTGSPGAGAKFFIGCETGEGAYFYGYMSNVRLVKGTGLYTTTFTPSQTPLQTVAGTQVLTNQSQSFIDNSPNFGVVTATNSPSVQRLSPFGGTTLPTPYYSNYFDGSLDYLSAGTNSAYDLGSGDFTMEAWVYINARGSSGSCFAGTWGASGRGWIWLCTSTTLSFVYSTNGTNETAAPAATYSVPLTTWTHLAAVRYGNTVTMYVNGTSVGSASVTGVTISNATQPLYIGANKQDVDSGLNNYQMNGNISNFRLVKGTAVYTANFTPSTTPLTAISGTSLLTCQSNTFVDNSTNNFTITANGDTKPRQISPFTLTYSTKQVYSQSVIGGSMYFDGTGDYVSSSNSLFAMGTGSFTWEAWVYWTGNSAAYRQIFSTRTTNGSSTTAGSLAIVPNTQVLVWYTASAIITTTATIPINTWAHVAMVRNGTAMTLYLNGVSVGTATNSDNLTASVFSIGANNDGSEPFMGYISDVRVTKNQAIYTSAFVPQNYPLSAIKNSIYLVNGTGAGIYNASGTGLIETVGDTKLNTAVSKFSGGSSLYFDGTGDWLHFPPGPNLEFGGGNFTLEFWFYTSSTTRQWFIHSATDYWFGLDYNSVATNKLGLWASGNGTSWNLINSDAGGNGICATTLPQNQWNHIAVTRNGNVWKVFLNGAQDLNITVAGSIVDRSAEQKVFGSWAISSHQYPVNGYVSDLRITKGYARYTSAFTPPTAPAKLK